MTSTITESRLRNCARRAGYRVQKSRAGRSLNNLGAFRLLDERNFVMLGQCFDASLADIADYLND